MTATPDLVIGLDSSTTSTKAIAWSRRGEAVAEGRAPIASSTPQPGRVEQDPEDWWEAACVSLKSLCNEVDPARLAGLAISNQRETVAFLGADGRACAPAIVWLDERSKESLPTVVEEFGGERLHRISGKPVDITPVVHRLAWLRTRQPELLDRCAKIVDVHGFLGGRLTGRAAASWTSADPFGVLDIEARDWSGPVLEYLGLEAAQFADLVRPGGEVGKVTADAARATGLPAGLTVFAAGGDGQCAGLGVNAVAPGTVYLNLGTAMITGVFSDTPRISQSWRTMTSPTGAGYFLEGCQRAGAFFVNWFVDNFGGGAGGAGGADAVGSVFDRLEAEATQIAIGADGVVVCPYLNGVMDPHWDPGARASFNGLAPHHGVGHLYRASLEAITLESARCIEQMQAAGINANRLVAVGGGANSELWTRMLSDATGLPLSVSESLEASALGAGMSAAVGAGWYPGFAEAADAMSRSGRTISPDASVKADWDAASARQAAAYRPSS